MKAILEEDANVDFRYWGGDNMAEVVGKPVKHISDLAFMGFIEVVANLKTILGNIKFCKQDILKYKPDALVLVDYPGFNLKRSEEHTSELQSRPHLVCRLLLEKKKKQ